MNQIESIRKKLFSLQDKKYAGFQEKLIPGVDQLEVIGVRTPALRKLAKELYREGNADEFLKDLPHRYFEENQLHAFIISEIKDYYVCVEAVEKFLAYVDNWATCDQMSPKVFGKNKDKVLDKIKVWIKSDATYTVRFAVGMLMRHFLDEDFDPIYLEMVAELRSDEYYINMMIAWYFATAMAKQYEATIPYIEGERLATWTHNKTIQKCVESYRISDDLKLYLKTLKKK